jgi:outer membrane lipoprotein-sorting protein
MNGKTALRAANILALVLPLVAATAVPAEDLAGLIKQAEARYAQFDKKVKDMTIVSEITNFTSEGNVVAEARMMKKGPKFRMESRMRPPEGSEAPAAMGMMETTVISDGKDTWMISPILGKQKLPPDEAAGYADRDSWWDFLTEGATVSGSEKVGERDCWVVDVPESKDAVFARLWLDKGELFMVQSLSRSEGETERMVQSDFRRIEGGMEMPFRTDVYSEGKLLSTTIVKSVEVNKGLSDDLFDPEKANVKGPDMKGLMKQMMKPGKSKKD